MHWTGLFSWAIGLIALFIIGSLCAAPSSVPGLTPSKAPRPLKPRTSHDCPVCQQSHPTPLWGNIRKPGVKPWSECKSARDPYKKICTAITCGTTGHLAELPGREYNSNR